MADLRIITYNTQGLQGIQKRLDIFDFLKNKKCHIYCLQDTHFTASDEINIRDQWGNNCIFSNNRSNARGVAILFGKELDYKIRRSIIDTDGNYIILDMTVHNQKLTLVNLYGPNNDKPAFFQNIANYIEEIGNNDNIICGDFNCVISPDLDYYNYKAINNPKARDKIMEIINTKYLLDPFRENYPTQKKFTWKRRNPCKQARLDFFLISESLMQSVKNTTIGSSYRSDHSIVILDLNLTNFNHGKSFWKHNNSLLIDPDYLKQINKKILDTKLQYALPIYNLDEIDNIPNEDIQFTINDQLFLDTLLMEIRGEAISYASFKNKQRNKRENTLIKQIEKIENNLADSNAEQLENLKTELYDIRNEKLKGYMIRSKAQYIDKGEKPTKFFCGLEKHNYTSKVITQLEKYDGSMIRDQNEILKETEIFYKNLYENKDNMLENVDLHDLMKDTEMNTLTMEEAEKLEGQLTYKEISEVLLNMKHDKSPGMTGFTAEFFKVFWRQLGFFVLRAINFGYTKGELSITQCQGIIICIPKENKPKQFLKNWRPLTLLDVVYKIASGTIASRIKSVIIKLISKDQTGFIKGRYIGENIRLIYDLMNYTEQNDIQGLLLLIDFEKAFDSLSWKFIQKALKYLNFGQSLIRWVDIFYKNISSAVSQCGYLSSFFNIGRGCRQGDPLSPYLFIICAEFLSTLIRTNKKIKGIVAQDTEFKISQFADDTSIFLDGSSQSLNSTLEELDRFAHISGLKINYDKTQLIWIGSKKHSADTIKTKWKLLWGGCKFKVLGINFNVDLENMVRENYELKIQQLDKIVKQWGKRSLSPLGKITVIKTFMISAFNQLFIMLPNPDQTIIDHMNNIMFNFLWNNKPSRIKKSTIIKQYEEGGLKMVNLNAYIEALKATWMKRLLTVDSQWQVFIKCYIPLENVTGYGIKYIEDKMLHIPNAFWKDVLQSIININKNLVVNQEDILKSPLYYSNNIKIGDQHICLKAWFKKGVRYINDLVSENGFFYQQAEFTLKTGIQTNFLQYNGLIQSIKQYLKQVKIEITHREPLPFIPSHILPVLKHSKGSKDMYGILNKTNETPTGQNTWNKLYNIPDKEWKNIHMFPFKVTKYPALQWFQISINHNILVTNKLLFQMKIKKDALCTFCQSSNESIVHLFWKCDKTQQFIRNVKGWLNTYNIHYDMNEKHFLLGLQEEHILSKILNFIILYAKYYIYLARCKHQALYISVFQKKLKFMYKVHKQIAFSNQEEETFQKDWSAFQSLIDDIA